MNGKDINKFSEMLEKEKPTGDVSYRLWLHRLESTLFWRKEFKYGDHQWAQAYDMYNGDHWSQTSDIASALNTSDRPKDKITVNVTASSANAIIPFLLTQNPEFDVTPTEPEDEVSAILQEAILNYQWRHKDMLVTCEKAITDCVVTGTGIIGTGYTLEVNEGASVKDGEIEYSDYVKKDEPFIEHISPQDFLFDITGHDGTLKTARWAAKIFNAPVGDVIANVRYKKSVRDNIRNKKEGYQPVSRESVLVQANTVSNAFREMDKLAWESPNNEVELMMMAELWDKKFRKRYVFAFNIADPLLEEDWPYDYMDEFPFEMVTYQRVPGSPYGTGVPWAIRDQQYELNRVRTRIFQHGRRFNRKYVVKADAFSPKMLQDLMNGPDGTVLISDAGTDAVAAIEDAPMSQDHFQEEQIILRDIQEILGLDALLRGAALPSRTTGTEVQARTQIFKSKLESKANNVTRFVTNIGRQLIKHIQANTVRAGVVELLGPQGNYWQSYTPEEIKAEVNVSVETVSGELVDPVTERQQALQLLQQVQGMAPLVQQGLLNVDFNELLKFVLLRFPKLKDVQRFFKPMGIRSAPLVTTTEQEQQQLALPPAPAVPDTGGMNPVDILQGAGMQGNSSGIEGGGGLGL